MPPPELWLFRHKDARWVQLTLHPLRIDRTEGVKGRASTHVYTLYKNTGAVKSAASTMRNEIHRGGYRRVHRLGKFVPVPVDQWQDTALTARKRKPALSGKPAGPLEELVAKLDATPGIALTYKRGKPASAKALAAAEKQLGRPLPPSLRAFLAKHDGLTVEWTLEAQGWGVAFEIFSLREMLAERKSRGDTVMLKSGLLLPIAPTFSRPVLGALLRDRGEAKIIELMEPPEGPVYNLAPSFATFVAKALKQYFVKTGRSDVSEKWLPAMRKEIG